jgi:hypothetical protein
MTIPEVVEHCVIGELLQGGGLSRADIAAMLYGVATSPTVFEGVIDVVHIMRQRDIDIFPLFFSYQYAAQRDRFEMHIIEDLPDFINNGEVLDGMSTRSFHEAIGKSARVRSFYRDDKLYTVAPIFIQKYPTAPSAPQLMDFSLFTFLQNAPEDAAMSQAEGAKLGRFFREYIHDSDETPSYRFKAIYRIGP